MSIPLLLAATVYAAGVVAGSYCSVPLVWAFPVGLGLVMAGFGFPKKRLALLGASIFVLGFCNQQFRTAIISPNDLRLLFGNTPAYVTVIGVLAETPYQKFYEHRDEITWRTIAEVDVQTVLFEGAKEPRPAHGRVAISTPGTLEKPFFGGQRLAIPGVISPPPGAPAQGLFNYNHFLRLKGIHYQLQVKSPAEWHLLSTNSTPPWADRFLNWAQRTLARGLPEEDEPLRLLWAMTLGWKTAMSGEVSEPFMRSGTLHVFAISGLHIVLIAQILIGLFKVLRIPRAVSGSFIIPMIWAYTIFTGFQSSAVRSTIMMTVIIVGWILKRPGNLLNSLGAAALLILIWDPLQLFQASFQLSFFVVLSLGLFMPKLEVHRKNLLAPDPFLPAQLRPMWRQRLDVPLHWLTKSLVTSLAAWLGSVPLVAYYFHLITPVSLLANILVVPFSSFALASNMASLLCGDWLPSLGELFNHAAWFFMNCMIWVSEQAADLPLGNFHVPPPDGLVFLIYYTLLLGVTAGWFKHQRLRRPLAAGLTCLLLLWLGLRIPQFSRTNVTVLPLHGGHAIFIDENGRDNDLLIDCGDQDSARHLTAAFLRGQGVNRLKHLLLTHGDIQHVGGAPLVQQTFATPNVLISPVRFRSAAYRAVRASFSNIPGLEKVVFRGSRVADWKVLHPNENDKSSQADDDALVLRGAIRGTTFLLLSDLSKPGQNALVRNDTNLQADIVISGLPVRTEPVASLFLDIVQPKLVIITDALFPARARASAALRRRLARKGIPVLYTSSTGAITLEVGKDGWSIQTASGLRLTHQNLQPAMSESASETPPHAELEESQIF